MNNKCLPLLCSTEKRSEINRRGRSSRRPWNGRNGVLRRHGNNGSRHRNSWNGYRLRSHFRRRPRSYSDPMTRSRSPRMSSDETKNPMLTSSLLSSNMTSQTFPSEAVLNALRLAEEGHLTSEELEKIVVGDVLWCSNNEHNSSQNPFSGKDPILFEPLRKTARERFIFIRENGSVVVFNVDSLVKFLVSTGDFRDPESRLPFTDSDIRRLDRQRTALNIQLPNNIISLLALKRNPKHFEEIRFREQTLHDLSELCGDVISQLVTISDTIGLADGVKVMKMSYLFSEFTFTWKQYLEAEALYVKMIDRPTDEHRHSQNSLNHFINLVCPEDKFFKIIKKKGVPVRAELIQISPQQAKRRRDIVKRSAPVNTSRKMVLSFLDGLRVAVMPQQFVVDPIFHEPASPTPSESELERLV